jgi:hypothetical protein
VTAAAILDGIRDRKAKGLTLDLFADPEFDIRDRRYTVECGAKLAGTIRQGQSRLAAACAAALRPSGTYQPPSKNKSKPATSILRPAATAPPSATRRVHHRQRVATRSRSASNWATSISRSIALFRRTSVGCAVRTGLTSAVAKKLRSWALEMLDWRMRPSACAMMPTRGADSASVCARAAPRS